MSRGHLYRIPIRGGFSRCPGAVAADRSDDALIADQAQNRVQVAPVRSGKFYGQKMTAGWIYPVACDGKAAS